MREKLRKGGRRRNFIDYVFIEWVEFIIMALANIYNTSLRLKVKNVKNIRKPNKTLTYPNIIIEIS